MSIEPRMSMVEIDALRVAASGCPRTGKDRWEQMAANYQEAVERTNTEVKQRSVLRRVVVFRYRGAIREHELRTAPIVIRRGTPTLQTHPELQEIRRRKRMMRAFRFWGVCEYMTANDSYAIIEKWERRAMAVAHMNGRNFLYAKQLMEAGNG